MNRLTRQILDPLQHDSRPSEDDVPATREPAGTKEVGSTTGTSSARSLRRFAVEGLCLLMLLYGAPLQALESNLPKVEGDAPDFPLEMMERSLDSTSRSLETAWQATHEAATGLVQQPWVDAFAMMLTASNLGATQETSSPPSPPSDKRSTKDYDLASLAAGFAEKDALNAIPLLPGWNQISLPEVPGTPDPATVLAAIGGSYSKAYTYDGCDAADPWKVYDPADPAGSDLTAIDVTQGLLVDATAAVSLPSDGTLPDSTTIPLCTGWNHIGFPSAQPRHVRSALAPIMDKLVRVFGFDPFDIDDPWAFFEKDAPAWASDLDTLEPGRGYWILITEDVQLEIKNVGEAPDIAFTSPLDLDVVTAPTEIHGRVASDLLESWQLRYRGVGETDWIDLATGNYPVDGKLGDFDPTLLLNGMYELELTATDLQGLQVSDSIAVVVEGNMKIGHFTLSFVDLAIPLSGLDIEVIRTYDSRQRHLQGDFGHGWSLDIRQGSYRNNRPPGDGWQIRATEGPWGLPCSPDAVLETKGHLTTIRLSDQEVYRFRLVVEDPGTIIGGCIGRADFEYVDGPISGATLEILGNTSVLYQNNTDELRDPNSFALYVPEDVKLTTRDGRIFHLDLADGVTHLEDLNGNTLDITPEGITHSSGRGVEFVRDAEGRIERIIDPMGNANVYSYGAAGDLATFTDRIGAETRFAYADGHYLEDIINALGVRAVRTEYDDDGRMVGMIDAAGKVIALEHDLEARREVITNRLGFVRVMEYDGRGNVMRETDELGHTIQRTYDNHDRLLSQTNALGHTTSFTYSSSGDVTSIQDPLGHTMSIAHGDRGLPLKLTDALGYATTNTYSPAALLASTRDAAGHVTTFSYNTHGELLSLTDALGQTTAFAFDGFGRLGGITNALGHGTTYTYDANGNRTQAIHTRTLPSGETQTLTTSFEYDLLGRRTASTSPDGAVRRTHYDALGRVIREIDPALRQTSYQYDARGLLESTTSADGAVQRYTYDDEGRRISSIDPLGRFTYFTYDPTGRLVTTTYPGSDEATETRIYDAAGQLTMQTDARGFSATHTYDAGGRRVQLSDSSGHTVEFSYDANNQLRTFTDALGRSTTRSYDAMGNLRFIVAPGDATTESIYDALGRRIATIDPAGKKTQFQFDALGRLVTVVDALGQETVYDYDELGNLRRQVNALGHATEFEVDEVGRPTARILPDGSRETMTYDAAGNLENHVDFNGATKRFVYDSMNRLIERKYPDGTSQSFTYFLSGQRATATDRRGGITQYTYDTRDRLIRQLTPEGHGLEYAYDENGNRTRLTAFHDEASVSTLYTYDARNQIDTVTDARGGTYDFAYDANGLPTHLQYPNGVVTTWTHDAQNRLTDLVTRDANGDVLRGFHYSLNANGHRTRVEEDTGTVRSFSYDDIWQLTGEHVIDDEGGLLYEETFEYDAVGNRLRKTLTPTEGPPEFQEFTYDARNRLVAAPGQTSEWDAAGRLLTRTGPNQEPFATYQWSYDDELLEAVLSNGTSMSTDYNVEGHRIRSEEHHGTEVETIDYVVDAASSLGYNVADMSQGDFETVYVRAGDHLLGLLREDGGDRYYHLDGLGSVRGLSDSTGTLTGTLDYTSYGQRLPGADESQAYGFASEPWNAVGLAYHRARWMDPAFGRFLSLDPFQGHLTSPASQHGYGYAHQNPVSFTDPTGLAISANQALAVGAIVGVLTTIVSPPLANLFGYQMSTLEAIEAGGLAFLFTTVALLSPPAGMAIALYGFHKSLQFYHDVWSRPSTPAQKSVAVGLLALSSMGLAQAGSQLSASGALEGPASFSAAQIRMQITRNRLLDELTRNGIKHTRKDVLRVAYDRNGRIVFLEKGNANAGLNHIIGAHADDFARIGISEAEIPDFVFLATTSGRIVGTQGAGSGRPIFEFVYAGRVRRVAVTIGDNGFIVGANPVGR